MWNAGHFSIKAWEFILRDVFKKKNKKKLSTEKDIVQQH